MYKTNVCFLSRNSEFFAQMVVDAVNIIKQSDGKGSFKYPIKAIRVLKASGQSMKESLLVNGFALNCSLAMQGMPKKVTAAIILSSFNSSGEFRAPLSSFQL